MNSQVSVFVRRMCGFAVVVSLVVGVTSAELNAAETDSLQRTQGERVWSPIRVAQVETGVAPERRSTEVSEQKKPTLEEVTVTASRIEREGFQAPTPTTVLGAEQIALSAPTNIADVVNQLPALAMGLNPRQANASVSAGGGLSGFNALNLRNLQPQRTLVLLDSRRIATSTASGFVNVNTIPQDLVERVEVVTGGASAAYGSDAVAGVVNFVLKEDFSGFAGSAQAGTTRNGDGDSRMVAMTFGHSFADDRAQLLLNARYADQEGIDSARSRDWYNGTRMVDYGASSSPRYAITSVVNTGMATPGGLILFNPANGPLAGTQFGPGGAPSAFQPGVATANALQVVGGQPNDITQYSPLLSPVEDQGIFGRFTFDATDNLELVAEASFVGVRVEGAASVNRNFGNLTIRADNAFLPTSVRDQMTSAGLASVSFGTWNEDIGRTVLYNQEETYRGVLGANLKLGETWSLNSYYQYGRTDRLVETRNALNNARYRQAIDAVTDTSGVVVCRNPANGCVPLNIIGTGVAASSAIDWVVGAATRDTKIEQHVVATELQGQPFSSWAGPVSFAIGAEYREDSIREEADALSLVNGWSGGNFKPINGDTNVKEAFVETVVPLAADHLFAKSLDLNLAARATDYSTSGSVTTWKAGATWRPFDDLLLRGVRSRDIRAPSFQESFPGSVGTVTATVIDRFNGNRVDTIFSSSGGNPNLVPEDGDTVYFGAVYSPMWLQGFNLSVDYYRIDLEKVIVQQASSVQAIMDLCFQGVAASCSLIERNDAGHVSAINVSPVNGASLKTSGIDVELSYRRDLGAENRNLGALTLRGLYSRVYEYYVDTGTSARDYNGTLATPPLGGLTTVLPDSRALLSATYERNGLSVSLTGRYIDSVILADTTGARPLTPNEIADNTAPAVTYIDAALAYQVPSWLGSPEFFLAVDNVFDKQPPYTSPGDFLFTGTALGLYDGVGTNFRAGFRVKF